VSIEEGCGFSRSVITGVLPVTENLGRAGPIALELDLAGISGDLETAKDQLIDAISNVFDEFPDESVQDLADLLLQALRDGGVAEIELGPATSDVAAVDGVLTNNTAAQGATIRLFQARIPPDEPETQGEGGEGDLVHLLEIEVGHSVASASVDPHSGQIRGDGDATPATVRIFNPQSEDPQNPYEEIEIDPDQSQVLFADTPLQSTVSVGGVQTAEEEGCIQTQSAGFSLNLAEEQEGGLDLRVASSDAAACSAEDLPQVEDTPRIKKRQPTQPLPDTGGDDLIPLVGIALIAAAVLFVLARRLSRD
jgi:hypothetical protein